METTPLVDRLLEGLIVEYVHDHRTHVNRGRRVSLESVLRDSQDPHHASLHQHSSSSLQDRPDVNDVLSGHSVFSIGSEPRTTMWNELVTILGYSGPLVLTFLLQYLLTVALVFSVGRLGSSELAAVSLSLMTANISGYAIIQGAATCLDTLCAQAYGRGDFNMVGVHYARCTLLLFMVAVPIILFWAMGVEPVLFWLIGDAKLASLAATYLRVIAAGLPGFILFENAKHFLQAQGNFHALAIVLGICAPMNAIFNYVLVWDPHVGMGYVGAPMLVALTNWLMCGLTYAYIYWINGFECWPKQPFVDKIYYRLWNKMLLLAIPGVLMVESEWLAFEIITLAAARFGTEVLAAQLIISTTCVLLYQIPFSLGIAAGTRVAWFVGAASLRAAQTTATATIIVSLGVGTLVGSILYTFRHWFASLYTTDPQVIELASSVLVIGSLYQINDALSCGTGGILRGQGRQKIGGYVNLIGYYLVAIPWALFFGFYCHMGLFGLWIGMIFALLVISLVQLYYVRVSKWDDIINACVYDGVDDSHPS